MEAGTNDVAGGHGAKPGGGSNAKGGAGNGGVVECQACGTERADAEARGERGVVGSADAKARGERGEVGSSPRFERLPLPFTEGRVVREDEKSSSDQLLRRRFFACLLRSPQSESTLLQSGCLLRSPQSESTLRINLSGCLLRSPQSESTLLCSPQSALISCVDRR